MLSTFLLKNNSNNVNNNKKNNKTKKVKPEYTKVSSAKLISRCISTFICMLIYVSVSISISIICVELLYSFWLELWVAFLPSVSKDWFEAFSVPWYCLNQVNA